MFRCYFCQSLSAPRTARHTVVLETRDRTYAAGGRSSGGRSSGGGRDFRPRNHFRDQEEQPVERGGQGKEIIKEVDACPACAAKQKALAAEALV